MNKSKHLAKILFLFFAVVSLGLAIVSCSDDDDDDAKTTTNTTQEEDDEDLDSIPIEEMTLEQLRKLLVGTWTEVTGNDIYNMYTQYAFNFDQIIDTITFAKNGSITDKTGDYTNAKFEIVSQDRIKFYNVPFYEGYDDYYINGYPCWYKLLRLEDGRYMLVFDNDFQFLDTDDLSFVTYIKIK